MGTLVRFALSRVEGKDLKSSVTAAPPSGSASVCWYSNARPSGVLRNTTLLHFYACGKESFYVWLVRSVIRNWLCTCSSPLCRKTARNTDVLPHSTSRCLNTGLKKCLSTKKKTCCCCFLHAITVILPSENLWDSYSTHIIKPVIIWPHDCCSILLCQTFTNAVLQSCCCCISSDNCCMWILFLYNKLFQKCLASASRRQWRRYHDCWHQLL